MITAQGIRNLRHPDHSDHGAGGSITGSYVNFSPESQKIIMEAAAQSEKREAERQRVKRRKAARAEAERDKAEGREEEDRAFHERCTRVPDSRRVPTTSTGSIYSSKTYPESLLSDRDRPRPVLRKTHHSTVPPASLVDDHSPWASDVPRITLVSRSGHTRPQRSSTRGTYQQRRRGGQSGSYSTTRISTVISTNMSSQVSVNVNGRRLL